MSNILTTINQRLRWKYRIMQIEIFCIGIIVGALLTAIAVYLIT